MNWHATSEDETKGKGDYTFIVDIQPDIVPYMAATDGDALLRIQKPGWSWGVLDLRVELMVVIGHCDTKEAAIGEAQAALAELRSGDGQ